MREFKSISAFVTHLVGLEVAIHSEMQKGLKKAARLIERDAKAEIGHYQPAVGPFQDWAPLADSTEADKARQGYVLDAPLLREGAMRDSIVHEVGGLEAIVGSKLDIAAYQEFGTAHIPPRPFLGPAAFKNKKAIQKILGAALVSGLVGGDRIHAALGYGFDVGGLEKED